MMTTETMVMPVNRMMKLVLFFLCFSLPPFVTNADDSNMKNMLMMPGERVSSLNRTDAICNAEMMIQDLGEPTQASVIDFYYAIESTELINTTTVAGRHIINEFEETLFTTIRDAVLWCYFVEVPSNEIVVSRSSATGDHYGPDRKRRQLQQQIRSEDMSGIGDHDDSNNRDTGGRLLSLEAARRLSIVSYSTSPTDQERSDITCQFPHDENNFCIVMHGMVTLIHHTISDISLVAASIWDATQMAMDHSDEMLMNNNREAFADIVNVEWLGETEDDAICGGPNGIGCIDTNDREAGRSSVPVAYAVTVPLLILLALALLVARNRTQREVLMPDQISAFALERENGGLVYVGTGDPPRSFHEGMYHYTRHGARYLSTNCIDCAETRRSGFYTSANLETINEEGHYEQSFEDLSLAYTSTSDNSASSHHKFVGAGQKLYGVGNNNDNGEEENPSDHRKRNWVQPSPIALGRKHSSIDVHNCSSATCNICQYRPQNVAFVGGDVCLDADKSEV